MTSARVNSGSSQHSQPFPAVASHRSADRPSRRLVSSSSDTKLSANRYNRRGCLLDDPNLGVISTNDHNVQACLCKYCSCGKHKCPGAPFFDPYPKSMFESQYQGEYLPGSLSKPMIPPKPLPKANLNQMDLLTIYERDYRPFRLEGDDQGEFVSPSRGYSQQAEAGMTGEQLAGQRGNGAYDSLRASDQLAPIPESAPNSRRPGPFEVVPDNSALRRSGQLTSSQPLFRARPPKNAPFPKFSGVSSYHVEFPSWGGSNPYYMKRMYDGVPTREMPFEAKTLYCDSYRPTGPKDTFTSKVAEMSKQGSLGVASHVKMFTQTSSGSAFQPIAKEFLAFATTEYKDKYVKQPPLMTNPHAVRRELEARDSQ